MVADPVWGGGGEAGQGWGAVITSQAHPPRYFTRTRILSAYPAAHQGLQLCFSASGHPRDWMGVGSRLGSVNPTFLKDL